MSLFEISPSFCVLPWVHLMTRPTGTAQICCLQPNELAKDDGVPYLIPEDSIREIWASERYREIRREMLEGTWPEGCGACRLAEETGKLSYRLHSLQWWNQHHGAEIAGLVARSRDRGFSVAQEPISLDLRLGNACNLACRSCHPVNSSRLGQEWEALLASHPEFREFWNGRYFEARVANEKARLSSWHRDENFRKDLAEILPGVRFLYLTGGEPTLVKGNLDLLRACVENGSAAGTTLMVTTNLTAFHPEFFGLFRHFREVYLTLSVDAFGAGNEYLRYPSQWGRTDHNLRALLRLEGDVHVHFAVVVQFHNVLNLVELLDYFEARADEVPGRRPQLNLSYLSGPGWLQATLLPERIRALAVERIRGYAGRSSLYREGAEARTGLDGLLALLAADPAGDAEALRIKNREFTRLLDESRGTRLGSAFPELHGMLEECGFYG